VWACSKTEETQASLRDDGGGAAGRGCWVGASVSQRLTALRAAEPQESIAQFLHIFYAASSGEAAGRC